MKNILIIISWLKIWWWAEKSATMVWNGLYEKWYNIKYLTFYEAKEKYDYKWEEFCLNEKISNNPLINFYKLLKRAWQIKKYCKKNNIDTVISHMEHANFPSILSKIFWNKSKITSVSHNNSLNKENYIQKLIPFFYKKSDIIVPVSKEEKKILQEKFWIKEEKILPIYNMFNISNIQEKSKEDLLKYKNLFNNWKFTFINIWRLSKPKNQQLLLNSFDKFHQQNPNSQLIILWDGELKEELQTQQKSLSSKEDIHFLWNQVNPFKFLANADCFVLSSLWEWFPMVIPEAMTCWLPLILSDFKTWAKESIMNEIQNFDEVKNISKEEYWILVPVDDENSLSQAMQDLYDDKDLQEYYSKQSKIRAKDFDVENIISEWEKNL